MSELVIRQIELGPLDNFNYIIADRSTGQAVIIDPDEDTTLLLGEAKKEKLTITAVLLTHGHYDHVGGATALAAELNIPVYLSSEEAAFYTPACPNLKRTADNDKIALGALTITCLHTPGHTPGCQCFLVEGNLFTGDTLFIDAVGRTDFPGGDSSQLFHSLQKIKRLPDQTIIWPGHNYGEVTHQTLDILKKDNPYLAATSDEDF